MSDALTLAIVTPWYGADLSGGAERTAWQMAHGLAERGHDVTVFTTCARSFAGDWGVDAHRAGVSREGTMTVRRYPVDARDGNLFDGANEVLLSQPPSFFARHVQAIGEDVADAFVDQSINSAALIADLQDEAPRFDAAVVLPYPYGMCIAAVKAAGDRAVLLPCLHDEPYAYLPAVHDAFRRAALIAFNTAGERRLAYRIFGPALGLKSTVVGQWVDFSTESLWAAERVNGFEPRKHRYLLYLGRRDDTKNVDMLVESFATFRRRERMSALQLILVGPGQRSYADPRHDVIDLGEVDDSQKAALLESAWALVQPSVNESFSRVIIEAWRAGTPVAVNARCEATADVVLEAGAGWTAATKAQWSALFHVLDRLGRSERDELGARGRHYVDEQTARERVLDRLETAVRTMRARPARTRFDAAPEPLLTRRLNDGRRTILFAGPLGEKSCIDQLLAGFAYLLALGIDARLALLGTFEAQGDVADSFFESVASAGLGNRVLVFESANPQVAAACYHSADLFWSMAEDGPESELVTALGYGIPVFAFKNERSAQTLGAAGLLFNDKREPRTLAGVAALILTDGSLRETLLEGQRRRFEEVARPEALSLAG